MGTLDNPDKEFDCLANAKPDEPYFLLLARDRHAPRLVLEWALMRETEGEDPKKVANARKIARDMEVYRGRLNKPPVLRIAFAGASGTGKSTLATKIGETLALPMNPIGSRSVARDMGFDSPYDVDKAGKRGEFQTRLVEAKMEWERAHESFVTDRTTMDNLTYTTLHDVKAVTAEMLDASVRGLQRYTHIIHCPVDAFCNPAGDPQRIQDITYHRLYEAVLRGLLDRHVEHAPVITLNMHGVEARIHNIMTWLRPEDRR